MEGYVYILQSKKTNRYYIGSTLDIVIRLTEHNQGRNKSTKNGIPWELVFSKKYQTIQEARRIEYKLKTFKSKIIIGRIIKEQTIHTGP